MGDARYGLGLTQAEVAEDANISLRSVQYFERGIALPNLDTLCKIAYVLRIELNELAPSGRELRKIYT